MVTHLDAMCGGHYSSGSADITYSICHATLQEHVIEGSCEFIGGSSLMCTTTLPSVVVISIVVVEIKYFQCLKSKILNAFLIPAYFSKAHDI